MRERIYSSAISLAIMQSIQKAGGGKREVANDAARERSRLGKAWFWISQVASVIGLISIIEDLRVWARLVAAVFQFLTGFLPLLSQLLQTVGSALHVIVATYRAVLHPVVDLLTSWLPFEVPLIAKDIMLVAVFVVFGVIRVRGIHFREYLRLRDVENLQFSEKALLYGIAVSDENMYRLKRAFSDHRTISYKSIYVGSLEKWLVKASENWEQAKSEFGPSLEPFVVENPDLYISPGMSALFNSEWWGLFVIYALGGVTVGLVALDLYLYA